MTKLYVLPLSGDAINLDKVDRVHASKRVYYGPGFYDPAGVTIMISNNDNIWIQCPDDETAIKARDEIIRAVNDKDTRTRIIELPGE